MPIRPGPRYSAVAQAFHWLTALLVLVAFIYGLGGTEQRVYAPDRAFERQLHETLGMAVFALTVLRVLWRLVDTRPKPAPVARWMGTAATLVQMALYVLVFAVPVTSIAGAWLEGHPVTLLGGIEIGPAISTSRELGTRLARLHPWLGDAIMWVAGFHAAAALFHHFVIKDGVLLSMLPRWLCAGKGRAA